MDPMLEAFLSESRDNLETAGKCFLALENAPEDKSIMDELFRAVHTIKGSSGLFDIKPFTSVVHVAEDILDNVRAGSFKLDSEHIDIFLDAFDQITDWLDDLESDGELGSDALEKSKHFTSILSQIMGDSDLVVDDEDTSSNGSDITEVQDAPEWLSEMPEEQRDSAAKLLNESENVNAFCMTYTPSEQCFFSGDDPIHTVINSPGLLWFRADNINNWEPLDTLDPFKSNLVFKMVLVCEREALDNHIRYIPEQVNVVKIDLTELGITITSAETSTSNANELEKPALNTLLQMIEMQSQMISLEASEDLQKGKVASICTLLDRVLPPSYQERLEWASNKANILNSNSKDTTSQFLTKATAQIKADIEQGEQIESHIETEQAPETTDLEPDLSTVEQNTSAPTSSTLPDEATNASNGKSGNGKESSNKVLRVDQARIDKIMDLVGELVVAKNALPYLAKRAEEEYGVRALAKEIKAQYAGINRLSDELQSAVMQVRMVPISSVFQRFPRLVRDLARKLNKNIKLTLEGEETEADKNIVEELADPLIHLIRNSLDHGLETSEERVAAGKAPQGNIILRAIPKDDQVIIEVIDDGKGIDPDIIKRKAYEKGVIDEEKLDSISDSDALQLIFAPGFSTAEQVSDLSGRGVGMDVVKTVINQSGGTVIAISEVGKGSTMRLTLPLSMAVTRVMMLEVSQQLYGISMENIVETVRVPIGDLQKIKHQPAVVLRDRLIPLFDLRKLLCVDQIENDDDELAVLVLKHGDEEIGLIIDEFHEGIDIIQKPLEGVMAGFPIYSGTALLGDGRVLLVLNISELVSCQ
jgi:two-component system chemotaxis sensor kinase CheA